MFLSHSSRDSRQAIAVKAWLIEQEPGLAEEIFLDLDPHTGIWPEERWKAALKQANTRCEAVICLLSKHWQASDHHACLSTITTVPGCSRSRSASTTASAVVGYARVSSIGQTLEQQTEALTAVGAGKVFHDVMSGARDDRPGFAECMQYLREGDTLIVWRLDRLGRNMRSIVNTLHELSQRGVTVRSLQDGVDTSTSTGRMVAGILMSIAEYERELVRERMILKLEHARKSGIKFGRPAKLNADQARSCRPDEGQRGNRRHHLPDAWDWADHVVSVLG